MVCLAEGDIIMTYMYMYGAYMYVCSCMCVHVYAHVTQFAHVNGSNLTLD